MTINFVKKYLNPLEERLIFWNIVLLIFAKIVLPNSALQLASLIESLPTFDSREIIKITNEARIINNLPPLRVSAQLDLAAVEKLNDMAKNEYFAHISPSGTTPWVWIKKAEYNYSVAGENLAIGFLTAEETVKAWMDSPTHKANVINSQYRDIGVAVKGVEIEGNEGILVVQMFGSLRPVTAQNKSQNKITPAPSPKIALASPQPAGTTAPQIQVKSIQIQQVSTDESIETVQGPVTIKFYNTDGVQKWSARFGNIMTVYLAILAISSIIMFAILEKNRILILRASLNFALFIFSLIIPISQISFQGMIY